MKKYYLFGLLVFFYNSTFSQTYERPDEWYMGINYKQSGDQDDISNDDNYLWFGFHYEDETKNRESWHKKGGVEPAELILTAYDFTFQTGKLERIMSRCKSDLDRSKIEFQKYVVYNLENGFVKFNSKGKLQKIQLNKEMRNSFETVGDMLEVSKLLDLTKNVYGPNYETIITGKITKYIWKDLHSTVTIVIDMNNNLISSVYSSNND
jgi:hypothetical protein